MTAVVRAGFELTEHTADVGVRAWGPSVGEVFEQAALATVSLEYDLETVRPTNTRTIAVEAPERDLLLAAWLNELLYLIDGERWVFSRFEVAAVGAIEDADARPTWSLRATAFGERRDVRRHAVRTLVKAATLHGLSLRRTSHGWVGEVLLDV
ncbi:MAG: archease [Actinobacteria bacterium]|nr:archease [Actinomycetota bacterium]